MSALASEPSKRRRHSALPSPSVWIAVLASLGALGVGCAQTPEGVPPAPETVLLGPGGVEGYRSLHALFYIVPTDDGVVVFDTGMDDSGETLMAAVAGRRVWAAFITHGHVDHFSGAWALGAIPVFVGEGDVGLITGADSPKGTLPSLLGGFLPSPRPPLSLSPTQDGDVVDAAQVGAPGQWQVVAHAVPGHTAGTTVWQMGNLLMSGDALLADGDGVGTSPTVFDDDTDRARASLSRLLDVDAHVMFDGHSGRTEAPIEKLRAFIANMDAKDDASSPPTPSSTTRSPPR